MKSQRIGASKLLLVLWGDQYHCNLHSIQNRGGAGTGNVNEDALVYISVNNM